MLLIDLVRISKAVKSLFGKNQSNVRFDDSDLLIGHGLDNLASFRVMLILALLGLSGIFVHCVFAPDFYSSLSFGLVFVMLSWYVNNLPVPGLSEQWQTLDAPQAYRAYCGGRILFTPYGLRLSWRRHVLQYTKDGTLVQGDLKTQAKSQSSSQAQAQNQGNSPNQGPASGKFQDPVSSLGQASTSAQAQSPSSDQASFSTQAPSSVSDFGVAASDSSSSSASASVSASSSTFNLGQTPTSGSDAGMSGHAVPGSAAWADLSSSSSSGFASYAAPGYALGAVPGSAPGSTSTSALGTAPGASSANQVHGANVAACSDQGRIRVISILKAVCLSEAHGLAQLYKNIQHDWLAPALVQRIEVGFTPVGAIGSAYRAYYLTHPYVQSLEGVQLKALMPMRLDQLEDLISASLPDLERQAGHPLSTHEVFCLGFGFQWLPKHTRKLHERMAQGLSVAAFGGKGSPDIHDLEAKNPVAPLVFSTDMLVGHTMILGTTGAGKTRLFDLLVSQAILRGDTVIVLDPKGDRDLQRSIIRAMYQAQRSPSSDLFFLDIGLPRSKGWRTVEGKHYIEQCVAKSQRLGDTGFGPYQLYHSSAATNQGASIPEGAGRGQAGVANSPGNGTWSGNGESLGDGTLQAAGTLKNVPPVDAATDWRYASEYINTSNDYSPFADQFFEEDDIDRFFAQRMNSGLNPVAAFSRATEVAERLVAMMSQSSGSESFRAYASMAITSVVGCLNITGKVVTLENIRSALADHKTFIRALRLFLNKVVVRLDRQDVALFFNRIHSVSIPQLQSYSKTIPLLLGDYAENTASRRKEKQLYETLVQHGVFKDSAVDLEALQKLESISGMAEDTARLEEEAAAAANTKSTRSRSKKKPPQGVHPATLTDLYKFYNWLIAHDFIQKDQDFDSILSMAMLPEDYYRRVTNGIMPYLGALTAGNLFDLLSGESSELPTFLKLIRKNNVFYVALHCLKDAATGQALGKLMMSDLAYVAGEINQQGKVTSARVSIFIDEASELSNESLVQLLNKSRSANFAITVATQSVADFSKRTGSQASASQIIANCNNIVAMRVNDPATAEVISSVLPGTEICQRSSSITVSENGGTNNDNYMATRSVSQKPGPLLPPSILNQLPDLEFFARLANGALYKVFIPLLKPSLKQATLSAMQAQARAPSTQDPYAQTPAFGATSAFVATQAPSPAYAATQNPAQTLADAQSSTFAQFQAQTQSLSQAQIQAHAQSNAYAPFSDSDPAAATSTFAHTPTMVSANTAAPNGAYGEEHEVNADAYDPEFLSTANLLDLGFQVQAVNLPSEEQSLFKGSVWDARCAMNPVDCTVQPPPLPVNGLFQSDSGGNPLSGTNSPYTATGTIASASQTATTTASASTSNSHNTSQNAGVSPQADAVCASPLIADAQAPANGWANAGISNSASNQAGVDSSTTPTPRDSASYAADTLQAPNSPQLAAAEYGQTQGLTSENIVAAQSTAQIQNPSALEQPAFNQASSAALNQNQDYIPGAQRSLGPEQTTDSSQSQDQFQSQNTGYVSGQGQSQGYGPSQSQSQGQAQGQDGGHNLNQNPSSSQCPNQGPGLPPNQDQVQSQNLSSTFEAQPVGKQQSQALVKLSTEPGGSLNPLTHWLFKVFYQVVKWGLSLRAIHAYKLLLQISLCLLLATTISAMYMGWGQWGIWIESVHKELSNVQLLICEVLPELFRQQQLTFPHDVGSYWQRLKASAELFISNLELLVALALCGALQGHAFAIQSEMRHRSIMGIRQFTHPLSWPWVLWWIAVNVLLGLGFVLGVELMRLTIGAAAWSIGFFTTGFMSLHTR